MLHGSTPSLFFAVVVGIIALCSISAAAAPLQVLPRAAPSEKALFPYSRGLASWTTLPGAKDALPLNDDTLRPHHVSEGPDHTYVKAPDGRTALRSHYPKGSYRPGANPKGGISFYAPGPDSVDLSTAKEATFGYSVMFPDGFEFVKGGKLPGLYGGDSDAVALSCSGGRRDSACFSARLMWRPEGAGEMYTYLPPYTIERFAANKKQCDIPNSDCNPTYGASISRGSFKFERGEWTTISERVKLNDAGMANGELELFVEGESVILVKGLMLRDGNDGRIRGMQMQSFFGGSKPEWATPKDQDVYFSNLSVAILSTFDGQSKKQSRDVEDVAARWSKTDQ